MKSSQVTCTSEMLRKVKFSAATAIDDAFASQRFQLIVLFFFFLLHFFSRADRSFLVANAQSDTFHIIFCSDGFCKMTGFTRAEVMQRSSTTEFLHGPMTSQLAVNLIKEALSKGFEKHFEILYYRKNGEYCMPTMLDQLDKFRILIYLIFISICSWQGKSFFAPKW